MSGEAEKATKGKYTKDDNYGEMGARLQGRLKFIHGKLLSSCISELTSQSN